MTNDNDAVLRALSHCAGDNPEAALSTRNRRGGAFALLPNKSARGALLEARRNMHLAPKTIQPTPEQIEQVRRNTGLSLEDAIAHARRELNGQDFNGKPLRGTKKRKLLAPSGLDLLLEHGISTKDIAYIVTCALEKRLTTQQLDALADIKRQHGSNFGFEIRGGQLVSFLDKPNHETFIFQRTIPLVYRIRKE